MKKILFVCHGNICRSPMAEFIMKDMVEEAGVAEEFEIASAATSREEIWNGVGNPVYPPARKKLAEHGLDPGDKRAVQMTASDYDRYDLLICMDQNNLRNMKRITGGDPERKMSLLLDWTDRSRDVADPWYSGDFTAAWNDIYRGCRAVLSQLQAE